MNLPQPYSIDRMLYDDSPDTITQLQKLLLFHTVPKPTRGEELLDGAQFPTYLGFFSQPPEARSFSSSLIIRQYGNITTVTGGDTAAEILVFDMGESHVVLLNFHRSFEYKTIPVANPARHIVYILYSGNLVQNSGPAIFKYSRET